MRGRLGLLPQLISSRVVTENIYHSPFDYQKQSLFAIYADVPIPSDKKFLTASCERIWETIEASRGNAFILFTSYSMLESCYRLLIQRLNERRYHPLKQGDDSRQNL